MRHLTSCVPKAYNFFGINNENDRFFDSFLCKEDTHNTPWAPAADIIEFNDKYSIRAELAGIKQEDIKITLDEDELKLEGKRKFKEELKENNYYKTERSYGSFKRSFRLSQRIQRDNIEALYKDGVLEINLFKSEESKPKEIEIKVN